MFQARRNNDKLQIQIGNRTRNSQTIFYRPQRSWAKVMFLQASVILSTGGGGGSLAGRTPPARRHPPSKETPLAGRTPPSRETPGKETPLPLPHPSPQQGDPPPSPRVRRTPRSGRTPQQVDPQQGDPPGRQNPPTGIRSMSGWYAYHWNAFLCKNVFALLPPANEVCGRVMFLHMSLILSMGGGLVWQGGHAW